MKNKTVCAITGKSIKPNDGLIIVELAPNVELYGRIRRRLNPRATQAALVAPAIAEKIRSAFYHICVDDLPITTES